MLSYSRSTKWVKQENQSSSSGKAATIKSLTYLFQERRQIYCVKCSALINYKSNWHCQYYSIHFIFIFYLYNLYDKIITNWQTLHQLPRLKSISQLFNNSSGSLTGSKTISYKTLFDIQKIYKTSECTINALINFNYLIINFCNLPFCHLPFM